MAACGTKPDPAAPQAVVLIVIDTLRADHLGCYGHGAGTSPNLDRLAARGTRFARATTQVPVTQPSVSCILTGRLPLRHGVRDNLAFLLPESEDTLAERMRAAGYRSAAVVGSSVLDADRGLDQGFESYDSDFSGDYPIYDPSMEAIAEELSTTRRRADVVTDLAIERVRGFGDDPYFLFVHYFDVHSHYDPPPEHRSLFTHPYDGEIHFVDAQIGRLLQAVGDRPDALIAVVADHGESFGEHGEVGHGFLLHESTMHVPFLLAGQGVSAGAVRDDLVGLVDVEPTLASLARLAPTASPRDGRDLLDPGLAPADQYLETLRTLLHYNWAPLRALRREDWKWIDGPDPQFFDLASDPEEMLPVAGDDPRARELAQALAQLIGDDDAMQIKRDLREPDPQRAEELAALGYVGVESDAPLPELLPDPVDMLPTWNLRQLNRARYRQAVALIQAQRLEEAVALLDTILTDLPGKVDALHNRGTALAQLGRMDEAREDFRVALEHDPNYVPSLRALSRDRLQREDYERALGLLEALGQLEPDDADHQYNLGACADRVGRTDLAVPALRRFLELAAEDDARRGPVQQVLAQIEARGP